MSSELRSICLLNCVEDAKSFLAEFKSGHPRWRLVSTHGSVNDYLKSVGIGCTELSSLISNEFLTETFKEASSIVDDLIVSLDKKCAEPISSIIGVQEINFFAPLYRYHGKLEYSATLKLIHALEVLFEQHPPETVKVYESSQPSLFKGNNLISNVVQLLSKKYSFSIEIETRRGVNFHELLRNYIRKLTRVIRTPQTTYKKILALSLSTPVARKSLSVSDKRKTILLFCPLYDLEFLRSVLPKKFNIISCPLRGFPQNLPTHSKIDTHVFSQVDAFVNALNLDKLVREVNRDTSGVLTMFAQTIITDFSTHLGEHLTPVIVLDKFHSKYPIHLGVWGLPPCTGSRALLVEYLLKKKVPVLGMQHGGSTGDQKDSSCRQVDNNFSYCTHFMTYGFDEQDLQLLCPNKQIDCEIIPVGSFKEHRARADRGKKKNKIDILFPLTNSISIADGAFRSKPDLTTHYQLEILKTLETFKDLKIVAKPFPGYTDKNFSLIRVLKHLRVVKVIDYLNLQELLKRYEVRAVIIEYPSTPLLEVIGKDTEIFLMADPVLPFCQPTLALLKKRVHYFEDIEELKKAIVKWHTGHLPRRRNNEYYNKYLFRENTNELILQTINDCIGH